MCVIPCHSLQLKADRSETESSLGVECPRSRNDIAYHSLNIDEVMNLDNGALRVVCMVFILCGGSSQEFILVRGYTLPWL